MTSMLNRPRAVGREPSLTDAVPPATRHSRPGWRDPRILIGLLILAASVVLGVKVVGGADDTVGVWVARHDLPSGTAVSTDDLARARVRFADADQARRYLAADQTIPTGTTTDRVVGAGEMVPREALGTSGQGLVEVPLAVAVDDVPATVHQGSRVDVWVTPPGTGVAAGGDQLADATRVLEDVVVVQVPKAVDSFAPSGVQQVIVGVTRDQSDDLGAALGQASQGRVVITRRG